MIKKQIKYYVYLSFTIILWSLMPSFSKLALKELNVLQLLFFTTLLASITLFSFSYFTKNNKIEKYDSKDYLKIIMMGLMGIFFFYIFRFESFVYAPVSQANIITYTYPILMIIFSVFILNSKITWKSIIAILFGFLGAALIFTNGIIELNNEFIGGYFLAFIAAILFAGFSVLGKKLKYNKLNSLARYYLVAFIMTIPTILIFSKFILPKQIITIISILVLGILTSAVAFYLWFKAIELEKISKTANIIYISPCFTLIWANIINSEPIKIISIMGLVLIILGILIQSNFFRK